MQEFLQKGLVEQYVPQPLDTTTLFDFLKLFEEGDVETRTRKLSALLDGSRRHSSRLLTRATLASMEKGGGRGGGRGAGEGGRRGTGRGTRRTWWGAWRGPPPPSADDMACVFFSVKGKEDASFSRDDVFSRRRDERLRNNVSKMPRPWRPGPPAIAPSHRDGGEGREKGEDGIRSLRQLGATLPF